MDELRKKLLRIAHRLHLHPHSLSEEIALAKFIEGKLRKAGKLFLRQWTWGKSPEENKQLGKKTFYECICRVWPHQGNTFLIDDLLIREIYPEICQPIFIYSGNCPLEKTSAWVEWETVYAAMHLCLKPVESAMTRKEFVERLEDLIQTVYHEADHLTLQGTDDTGGMENALYYLMNKGEIRAYSKEIAYFYVKKFPGKRFHYGKFISYLRKHAILGDQQFHYLQYLEILKRPTTAPITQRENIILAEKIMAGQHPTLTRHLLKQAFAKYIVYISFFVTYFHGLKEEPYQRKKGIVPQYFQSVL